MLVVYFSSVTENTRRFVDKLGLPSKRIPLYRSDEPLIVDEPYVLICPTYGGGASISHQNTRPVPKQVIRFLNNEHNRSLIRGVIAAGNSNFGPDYCIAGDVISQKCKVPYLYRFELLGMPEDVERVRDELIDNAERLGLQPMDPTELDAVRAEQAKKEQEKADTLARLRARYDNRVRN
ncbi:ribonucleotide reductase stimulatory protein [Corynebacterium pilosum]|uniref:Protein NrdI n=1 Tax=Corynebacterium pilosum TaxID=35756 RepID=A0A376CM38_9CORY|nr:class Ib ribonucleoside-diphosphate reductase assembly flavoprotein NrdI [Corynebacterium pilosum]STC68738.1 ribonucleotide reductase stimulatory protein [Corynebacterium pilosum]